MVFLAGIIPILIVISFIVTIHELGHFSVARLFNTKVERFSVGFGPILLSKTDKHGVQWCLSAIPLGGYVKFAGDDTISSMSPDRETLEKARIAITARHGEGAEQQYFHFKPLWQRALIILAGPVSNFVLAIFIFSMVLMTIGGSVVKPVIDSVAAGSPAEKAGFRIGDEITSIDGRSVKSFGEIQPLIMLRANSDVLISIKRGSEILTLKPHTLQRKINSGLDNQTMNSGYLGIGSYGKSYRHIVYSPIDAIIEGNRMTWGFLDTNLTYIGRIFSGKEKADQISGLIGMTQASGQIAVASSKEDISFGNKVLLMSYRFLMISALISVGVGFINLVPIPMLDGGHLLFYAIEAVTQKPVNAAIQDISYRIGIASLLGLMLFAAFNDLSRNGAFKAIGSLFS